MFLQSCVADQNQMRVNLTDVKKALSGGPIK